MARYANRGRLSRALVWPGGLNGRCFVWRGWRQHKARYTIIGDAVNFGARLEKHSKIERVTAVTDSATFELARSQGYASTERWRYRLGREIAGVDYPVDLAVLIEAGRSSNGPRLPVAATV